LIRCSLSRVDLRGAVLRDTSLDAETTIDDVITDHSTDFEGLRVSSATSRNSLFKDYIFEDGRLRRRSTSSQATAAGTNADSFAESQPVGRQIRATEVQLRHLMQNAILTRITAQQLADQIERALLGVPATDGNMLVKPLQTMLEFAQVLRNLATDAELPSEPLDRVQLELRIAELEALVDRLTRELADETKAREAAEALGASDGFMANFRKSAGKASGVATVSVVASIATVGVHTAAVHFLGLENPLVSSLLAVLGRLPK
jgi:uncharacterized small protein (DUF1192 family)